MLLDGRRIVPASGTGVVDVNVIPASLVESVEVISGGASAVCGSDAIAGVVNFKLKRKFHGIQFDGGWGQADQGDAAEYSVGLTAGTSFADGRGEVFGYVGCADREAVRQSVRDHSAVALGYVGAGEGTLGPGDGFLPEGSLTIAKGWTILGPSQRPNQAAIDALFASYGYAPRSVQSAGEQPGEAAVHQDPWVGAIGTEFHGQSPRVSLVEPRPELPRDVARGWRRSGVRACRDSESLGEDSR